jgi:4-amino-4-deoxy-L-arabinose transferase-like glycosyltransferase
VAAAAGEVGWRTLGSEWLEETLGRSATPREGHWGPPGYHLVLLAVLFWPGSLVTLHAVRAGVRRAVSLGDGATLRARWRGRCVADEASLFLLAWLVPSWLVFEVVGTKLPHYTLPLYPAVALLTARAACDLHAGAGGARRTPPAAGVVLWATIGVGLTAGLPVGVALAWGGRREVLVGVLGGLAACVLVVLAAAVVRRSLLRAHALGIAGAVVFAGVFLQWVLPRADELWVTRRLAGQLGGGAVAAVGYTEDSLRFATRGRLRVLSPGQVGAWAAAHPGGVLILPAGVAGPEGWASGASVGGLNYSNGDRVDLIVWRGGG